MAVSGSMEGFRMGLRRSAIWCATSVVCAFALNAWLPMHFAMVGTATVMLAGALLLHRQGARRYARAIARVEAVKGVRSGTGALSLWSDPARRLEQLTHGLIKDLEDSYFRLIKTNIQLLALKEVGRSIISSLDPQRTVDSVLDYLNRGVGFNEYGLFTWNAVEGVLEGGVRRRCGDHFEWVSIKFQPQHSQGVIAKSLGRQRSHLIKDAGAHLLGSVEGTALFPESTHESFVVVPLIKSSPMSSSWERKGRQGEACPACSDTAIDSWTKEYASTPESDLLKEENRCWKCAGTPVIGCILATDLDREQPLSKVDLIMLETLGQNLATVLENAQLYEDLRHEERFRENVIGGLSNGLISVGLDGDISLCNQEAERLSGYREAELLGRPGADLIVDAGGRDPLAESLAGERSPGSIEGTLRTADGRRVPIQLTTSLLRDDRGDVYGAIGEFVDLSAIKSMQAKIRHLDKLAAMGRFTSSIAHEIRNPLAGITAGIQFLARNMQGEEAEHVKFILAEVDRLNRIINDLFSVGRPLELRPRATDAVALVDRSLKTLATHFEQQGVRFEHHRAADLPNIDLDADRIEQVLINFIQNAVDASPAGSTVTIVERLGASLDPLGDSADVDSLIIDVQDQGEGISEEDKEKIFEPFYTTKSSGTGLGLYVCHHIVEGHGGQIVVESQRGQGSRFLLCLPLGRSLREGTSETADLARR